MSCRKVAKNCFFFILLIFSSQFFSIKSESSFDSVKSFLSGFDKPALVAGASKVLCATWSKYERSGDVSVQGRWVLMLERAARVGEWLVTYAHDDQLDTLDIWALYDVYAFCHSLKELCSQLEQCQVQDDQCDCGTQRLLQEFAVHGLTLLEATSTLYGLYVGEFGRARQQKCAYALSGIFRSCDELLQANISPEYNFVGQKSLAAAFGLLSFICLAYHALSGDEWGRYGRGNVQRALEERDALIGDLEQVLADQEDECIALQDEVDQLLQKLMDEKERSSALEDQLGQRSDECSEFDPSIYEKLLEQIRQIRQETREMTEWLEQTRERIKQYLDGPKQESGGDSAIEQRREERQRLLKESEERIAKLNEEIAQREENIKKFKEANAQEKKELAKASTNAQRQERIKKLQEERDECEKRVQERREEREERSRKLQERLGGIGQKIEQTRQASKDGLERIEREHRKLRRNMAGLVSDADKSEVVDQILNGEKVYLLDAPMDRSKQTPAHYLVQTADAARLTRLLALNPDLLLEDYEGKTPLHKAANNRVALQVFIDCFKQKLGDLTPENLGLCGQIFELYTALLRTIFKRLPDDQAWENFVQGQRDNEQSPCSFLTENDLKSLLRKRSIEVKTEEEICEFASWSAYAVEFLQCDEHIDQVLDNFRQRFSGAVQMLDQCQWTEKYHGQQLDDRIKVIFKGCENEDLDYEAVDETIPLGQRVFNDVIESFMRGENDDVNNFYEVLKSTLQTYERESNADFKVLFNIGYQPPGPFGVAHQLIKKIIADKVHDLNDYKKCFELLFEKCPELRHEPNTYGQTPLHVAVQEGHEDLVRMLLDLKASINLGTYQSGPQKKYVPKGKTVLEVVNQESYEHQGIKELIQKLAKQDQQ
ncbi:MAG: ankyrin repeat domain-containing protein [Epsilonproteobacteria bacterium]|nr:ankyrin repeat domain-containing protein [Campylobacterota bacterium]